MKDTSAVSNSASIQSLKNKVLAFPIFRRQRNEFRNLQKPFFKALQPSLKLDLQISYNQGKRKCFAEGLQTSLFDI